MSPNDNLVYYKKYWFDCDKCPHDFETNLNSVAKLNTWCPYCANKKLCDDDECIICFDKSFAVSDKAIYLSSKNNINPRNYFKNCAKPKFIFDCPECNSDFESTFNNITTGKWCKSCGYKSAKEKQSLKLDEFLQKAQDVHGDRYNYSNVVMNGVDRPVAIICSQHGEFLQTPWNHYGARNGCPECGRMKSADCRRFTQEDFINRANVVHEFKYDYSMVIYINSQTYVTIICKLHGEFQQVPASHLQGVGCRQCGVVTAIDKQRLTVEEFIERAQKIHGDRYDYTETIWVDSKTHVSIRCKEHGTFMQDPNNHLNGFGCKKCNGKIYTLEEFTSRASVIHNGKYDYSFSVYTKSVEPVNIKCLDCKSIFQQSPNSHLNGSGCIFCKNKTEKKLFDWFKQIYQSVKHQVRYSWCKNIESDRFLPFDFEICSNILVELDGRQHFQQVRNWLAPELQKERDLYKMQCAFKNNMHVIRVYQEDVWNDRNDWKNKLQKSILELQTSLQPSLQLVGIDSEYYDI